MQELWDTMDVYLVSFQFTLFLIITVWWDFTSVPLRLSQVETLVLNKTNEEIVRQLVLHSLNF